MFFIQFEKIIWVSKDAARRKHSSKKRKMLGYWIQIVDRWLQSEKSRLPFFIIHWYNPNTRSLYMEHPNLYIDIVFLFYQVYETAGWTFKPHIKFRQISIRSHVNILIGYTQNMAYFLLLILSTQTRSGVGVRAWKSDW